ncbi:MAG: hypothetical protein GF320_21985, partial [Armatimonadia bacterium]|nr:hypothetical protein [Armatimonadia bacterium]
MRSAMSLGLVLAALLAAPGLGSGDATIVFEPWARFDEATTNAPQHAMTSRDAIGDVMLNTLSLHPGEEPTRLVFESVSLPELAEGERLLLIGRVAMRVGISWDDPDRIVDGSTFRIDLGGERLLEETVTESIWVPFAVDLGEWAGRSPSLTFETDARESVAYDWAIFGDPIIVHLTPGERGPGPGVWLTADDPARDDMAPVRRGEGLAGTVDHAPLGGEFYSFPGRAELESLAPSHPIVESGEPVRLRARLRSVGRGTVRAGSAVVRLDNLTPEAMSLSRLDLPVPEIRPGDVDTVSCVAEMSQGGRVGEIAAWLNGREVLGRFASRPRHPEAIVESGDLAIEVIAADGGAVGAVMRFRAEHGWRDQGQIWPLATVWAEPGTPTSASWRPVAFTSIERRGESVLLTATCDHWRAELFLSPAEDGAIACRAALTALTPLELRAWRGPTLLGGAGAYGELKGSALFPGIELLVGRERSSDPRHAFPPISDKMVPDPLAITVPLMAVAGDGSWVAMEWDPLREWAPGEALPSARFASPDFLDGHQAHSASLFAPSVPQYVDEDESLAARPYSMETGDEVTLECVLRAGPGDAVDALRAWVERHGLPEPDPARSYAAEQRLSRRAWLDTLWSESAAGWAHIVGGDPSFVPAYAVLALRDTYENPHSADAPRLMRRVRRSLDRALAEHGAGVLASRTGAHIMRFEAPFWLGHPIEGTLGAQRMARAMMAGQGFDGVW